MLMNIYHYALILLYDILVFICLYSYFVAGYFTVLSLIFIIGLAGLGYAHQRTNILAKFLPSVNCDCEPMRISADNGINSDHDKDIAHSELMDEVRLL